MLFLKNTFHLDDKAFTIEIFNTVQCGFRMYETPTDDVLTSARGYHKILIVEHMEPTNMLAIAGRLFDLANGIPIGLQKIIRVVERDQADLGTGIYKARAFLLDIIP